MRYGQALPQTDQPVYAVVDGNGVAVAVSADPHEAAWAAQRLGGAYEWRAPVPGSEAVGLAANPPQPMPVKALISSTLGYWGPSGQLVSKAGDEQACMSMSVDDAKARLAPVFEQSAWAGWAPWPMSPRKPGGFGTADSLTQPFKGILKENYKLEPKPGMRPAIALGVVLLPESTAFTGRSAAGASVFTPPAPANVPAPTLCIGSSPECRATCLLYVGQNQSNQQNNESKMAMTRALLADPQAFMRLLVASIENSLSGPLKYEKKAGATRQWDRFVRLNVLSDLPWELIAPWFFRRPEVQGLTGFYDYTKVRDRVTPANYDLSFSFSGTNWADVTSEMSRGRRSVFVFVAPEYTYASQISSDRRKKINALPEAFSHPLLLGGHEVEVVDGDKSDIRPRDPGGVVVGLRWKRPRSATPTFSDLDTTHPVMRSDGKEILYFVIVGHVVQAKNGKHVWHALVATEDPSKRGGKIS